MATCGLVAKPYTSSPSFPEFVAVPASLSQSHPRGSSPRGHFVRFCTRFLRDCGFDSACTLWPFLDRNFAGDGTQEKTVAAMPTSFMQQPRITHEPGSGI